MFKALKALGKNPDSSQLYAALLELYRFAYILVVLPVFVLSLLFTRGLTVSDPIAFIYLGLSALLCGVSFYLAEKPSSLESDTASALQRAMRLALVSALPAVFGLVSLAHPWAGKVLVVSSMVLYLLLQPRLKIYSQTKNREAPLLEGEKARVEG